MKIIYNFLIVLLLTTSCSGFLEEENLSNIVADEFYLTEEGFESLVNANYSSLRNIYGDEPYVFTMGTDLYTSGRGNPPAIGLLNYRDLTAAENNGTEFVRNLYQDLYAAIQLANNGLHFREITEETDNLPIREGEIRFLRAYYYFLLVQSFGDVPLVTERITEALLEFPRTPAVDVYTFIVQEMETALGLVPEAPEAPGRVGKRTIRHFLAKVHLTRGYETYGASDDFDVAAQYADDAIAGQGLNLTFEELFYPGNEQNEEVIFAIQYSSESMLDPSTDGNTQNYWFGPYMGGEGTIYGYPNRAYGLVPALHAFEVFTDAGANDSRWEATFMTQLYEPAVEGGSGNTVGYYRYYNEADNRDNIPVRFFYAHEWVDVTAWRAANPAARSGTTVRPFSADWEASPNTTLDNATPAIKKFDDPSSVFSNNGSSTRDIFLARLGETYLIAAEAYLMAGNAGIAADRINVVRRRAATSGNEDAMEIDAADVDIDFILDERARELLGEYHRWFDLKRTGTLVERNLLHNREVRDLGSNPFGDGTQKILRPIPQSVINLNEALSADDQNPGY